jgi:uncharacterized Zn finger protein
MQNPYDMPCCECEPLVSNGSGLIELHEAHHFGQNLYRCKRCGTVQSFVPAKMEKIMSGQVIMHETRRMNNKMIADQLDIQIAELRRG